MRVVHLAVASAVAIGIFIGGASASPSSGTVVADAAATGTVQTGNQTQVATTIPAQTATQTQNIDTSGSKAALNPQPLPPKVKVRHYAPGTFVTLNPQPLPPKIKLTGGLAFGFRR